MRLFAAVAAVRPAQRRLSGDVQPILKKHCYSCHGPQKQKGEYRLDVKEVALRPEVVELGNSAASPLDRVKRSIANAAGRAVPNPQISEVKIANFWKARRVIHFGQEITSGVFT
jgi:hypothetical protein